MKLCNLVCKESSSLLNSPTQPQALNLLSQDTQTQTALHKFMYIYNLSADSILRKVAISLFSAFNKQNWHP